MTNDRPRHIAGRALASLLPYGLPVLFCVVCQLGCSREEENRVGGDLLPPSVTEESSLRDTVFVGSESETDFQLTTQLVPLGSSSRLIAAADDYFSSRVLLRFGFLPDADQLLHFLKMRLSVKHLYPEDSPPSVMIYELLQGFSESTTGEDIFPAYLGEPLAEGEFGAQQGDTAAYYDFTGAALDSVLRRWIEGTQVNAGLLLTLAPEDSGRIDFHSREASVSPIDLRPRLELATRTSTDDTSAVDTTLWFPDRDTSVSERGVTTLAGLTDHLTVGSGIGSRSLLRFDLIPTLEGAVVHRATLTLHVDQSASRADSLMLAAELVDQYPWAGEETYALVTGRALTTVIPESSRVSFELVHIAREWVDSEEDNTGVRVRVLNEGEGLSWIRFFSSTAAESLRPTLEITTSPPLGENP